MFCPKCGAKIDDDSIFCQICGNAIDGKHYVRNNNIDSKVSISPKKKSDNSNENTSSIGIIFAVGGIVILLLIAILWCVWDNHRYDYDTDVSTGFKSRTDLSDTAEEYENDSDSVHSNPNDSIATETTQNKEDTHECETEEIDEEHQVNSFNTLPRSNRDSLPDEVFEIVQGHYEDGYDDTVDFEAPNSMIRFISGGNQDHFYNEVICGYKQVDNGYLIYVICDDYGYDEYVYYYTVESGIEKLYTNFDDGFNPSMENFFKGVCYVKGNSESTLEKQQVVSEDPWKTDGAYEGGLTDYVYGIIRGTYRSESKDITITVKSPTEMYFKNGKDETVFNIDGCDSDGYSLYIYVNGIDGKYADYQNVFLVWYSENKKDLNMIVGSGTWSPETFNISAQRVDDNADLSSSSDSMHSVVGKVNENDYIIPDSAYRLLTETDLVGLSNDDLRKARNEIVARHGRRFKDAELQEYFNSKSWYTGAIAPDDFDNQVMLSDIERSNMDFIKQHE